MTTISASNNIARDWYKVDADQKVLGRLAAKIASVLRGKHKPIFTPHVDTGDYIVVINSDGIKLTGKKAKQERHHWHTGYPGGIKSASLEDLIQKDSAKVLRRAVKNMLPKGPLGRDMLLKLKIYPGTEHPHVAQKLQSWPFEDKN